MNIYQALDVIDYGDAVSNHVVNIHKLLKVLGHNTKIYTKWIHEKRIEYYNDINKIKVNCDDILLYHYSGKSAIIENVKKLKCKKVMVYHNITPSSYFEENKDLHELCEGGICQLKKITSYFDGFIADSEFNKNDLISMGIDSNIIDVVPIYLDFERINNFSINKTLVDTYQNGFKNFLFVGRVVPNKKIEDIISIFSYYYTNINRKCNLFIVGNLEQVPQYYDKLIRIAKESDCAHNIFFTGKVCDADLYSYYSLADLYICMSEHEGFCVPLVESMYFKIPVIAYDACAIKYTMGGAGVLVYKKDYNIIGELCNVILQNNEISSTIIENQNNRIKEFDKNNIMTKLLTAIEKYS